MTAPLHARHRHRAETGALSYPPFRGTLRAQALLAFGLVLMLALSTILAASTLRAEEAGHRTTATAETETAYVTPGQMGTGALLLQSKQEGKFVEAPRLHTDFRIKVAGPVDRTTVTQRFTNPTDGWVEGIYVFPLPEGAAVDRLKMRIGERLVEGRIEEKAKARADYEAAKAEGRKASLVEQERPNVFTTSVANIGPGETVDIEIAYQETLRPVKGEFRLRLPLVVAPRYTPGEGAAAHTVGNGSGTEIGPDIQIGPNVEIGTGSGGVETFGAPVLDPRKDGRVNPVTIHVSIDAGFPLAAVKSATHAVVIKRMAGSETEVELDGQATPADRDFELVWSPQANSAPAVKLFRETVGGSDYLLAYLTPPAMPAEPAHPARDVVFVLDNSGSMAGPSMDQAKAGLDLALARLRPEDRFNLIRFDDTLTVLFRDVVPATPENVAKARDYVRSLDASGGTEMLPALRAALLDAEPDTKDRLRQVVFLTDGAISNENEMFDLIGRFRGRSRIFMVGIGSAPNSFLMTRAAELGRGTFTHIATAEQVAERMGELFQRLESPAATGIAATVGNSAASFSPDPVPDLYYGEPVLLLAKAAKLEGTLSVAGVTDGKPWQSELPLDAATTAEGIGKLWARRAIADLEVNAHTDTTVTPEQTDKAILALALEHGLVSRVTSLVAIDVTPTRPTDETLDRKNLPLNLPAGWDFDKVFGEAGGDAGTMKMKAFGSGVATRALVVTAKPDPAAGASPDAAVVTAAAGSGVTLPQTATSADRLILAGILTLLLAAALVLVVRMAQNTARSFGARQD